VDLVTELLDDLRVQSALYSRFEMRGAWAVEYPRSEMAGFHLVSHGRCVLEGHGGAPLHLGPGDLVVLPGGTGHVVRGSLPARGTPVADLVARSDTPGAVRVGTDGEEARFLCGGFRFAAGPEHPLLSALPAVIHVSMRDAESHPWLTTFLSAMECESTAGRPGAEMVMSRLADILFVQAVRAHLAALPDGARGWVGALRDPTVAAALALIHRNPEMPWTVESLGRAVGLSRSQFAARFSQTVGEPPVAYLAGWRTHRAKALLREGTTRVSRIAHMLGYGSEAAFSTAFRRWTGTSPGAYRRALRAGDTEDVLATAVASPGRLIVESAG
jgi:AraC-like DNA-binding protein